MSKRYRGKKKRGKGERFTLVKGNESGEATGPLRKWTEA